MRLIAASLGISMIAACGGGGGDGTPDANEALACLTSGRGDTYAVGLEHVGASGALDFKLMDAVPAPPGRNLNAWKIQINQMASGVVGAPATGAQLIVAPFMPDHQHGPGAYKVKIQESTTTPGEYQLNDINTWMPGYWEVTIDATVGSTHDTVLYKFCIQA